MRNIILSFLLLCSFITCSSWFVVSLTYAEILKDKPISLRIDGRTIRLGLGSYAAIGTEEAIVRYGAIGGYEVIGSYEAIGIYAGREESSGKALWQRSLKVQEIRYKERSFLYLEHDGAGIVGKDKKYRDWHVESYYYLEGTKIIPYLVEGAIKNRKGKVFETLYKYYDREAKKVICEIEGKRKVFEFKDDLVDKENVTVYLSNYSFKDKKDLKFHYLSHEPELYKMTAKYKGLETFMIDSSTIECYKLEITPDLGALGILGVFVPKTYLWYKADGSLELIRYQGLEAGLDSPYIIMDVVEALRYE